MLQCTTARRADAPATLELLHITVYACMLGRKYAVGNDSDTKRYARDEVEG